MNRAALTLLKCFTGAIVLLAGPVWAKDPDLGLNEFKSKCAICHGVSGKGDGPYVKQLTTKPADLTILAKENGGVLPKDLEEKIDGREEVAAHGSRDMPVWGYHNIRAGDAGQKTRMKALLDYLARIQVK